VLANVCGEEHQRQRELDKIPFHQENPGGDVKKISFAPFGRCLV